MGRGRVDRQSAFMDGRMRVWGDIGLGIRLADIFGWTVDARTGTAAAAVMVPGRDG